MEQPAGEKPAEQKPVETKPVETKPVEQKVESETMEPTKTPEIDFAARTNTANNTVKKYMIGSLAVGLIPIPLLDLAAVAGVQLKMLHSLAGEYDIGFSKEIGKSAIASLLGGVFTTETAIPVASLIKAVPFVGQVSGAISVSVLSAAATYAVGKVFIQHFESGGTFLDFDPEKVREHFAEQLKEGEKVAANLKASEAKAK